MCMLGVESMGARRCRCALPINIHICDTKYHTFAAYVFAKYAAKWGLIPVVTFSKDEAQNHRNEESLLKHISESCATDDVLSIRTQFFAQTGDVYIDGAFGHNDTSPDCIHQLLTGEDPPAIG